MPLPKTARSVIFLLACSILGCGEPKVIHLHTAAEAPFPGTQIFRQAVAATVVVRRFVNSVKQGWGTATCVATKVENGLHFYILITARHVVERETAQVLPPTPKDNVTAFQIAHAMYDDAGRMTGELTAMENSDTQLMITKAKNGADLAVLVLVSPIDLKITPVKMLTSEESCEILPGTRLWSMGAPIYEFPSLRSVYVSAFVPVYNRRDEIFLDMAIDGGCSGGGLFDEQCRFCGVVIAMFNTSMTVAIAVEEVYDLAKE